MSLFTCFHTFTCFEKRKGHKSPPDALHSSSFHIYIVFVLMFSVNHSVLSVCAENGFPSIGTFFWTDFIHFDCLDHTRTYRPTHTPMFCCSSCDHFIHHFIHTHTHTHTRIHHTCFQNFMHLHLHTLYKGQLLSKHTRTRCSVLVLPHTATDIRILSSPAYILISFSQHRLSV